MRALFLVSHYGPAEAALVDHATGCGHQVDILDVQGPGWLQRSAPQNGHGLNRWATYWPMRSARNQVARMLRKVIDQGAYDAVFTMSLPAAGFAARYLEEGFVPVLWRGDLDFSAARTLLTEDVQDLTAAVDRIFLQDEYEFDKALSKSSRSAHLLHLDPRGTLATGVPMLDRRPSGPQVVMLHPEGVAQDRCEAQAGMLRQVAEHHGGTLTTLSASALYRRRDVHRRRPLAGTAAARLEGFTHVVLTGSSRDHQAVADLLLEAGDGDRLVVEETIGMGYWAADRGFTRTGRGARLAGALHEVLDLTSAADDGEDQGGQPSGPSSGTQPGQDLLRGYLAAMGRPVERSYEQLQALQDSGPLNVFFSTSPLEDRTDGARPQRVRNMATALDRQGSSVRLYSTPSVFERRAKLVERLLDSGRPAGLLYGENSTSPIPFEHIPGAVATLAQTMRRHGGRSAWFVRDLHWLEEFDGYLDEADRRAQMQHDGLRELQVVEAAVDVLVAPSDAAGTGFNALLERHGEPARTWFALPPAVAPQNTAAGLPEAIGADEESTTLLYAGGVSELYGLDEYLAALNGLDESLLLDFVVRPLEVGRLHAMLELHGLQAHPGLRVITESLEWYVPRSRRTIGAVLLGGSYARFSFPYKTMSLIERGYAVLCFEDMAIADFVQDRRIGVACPRSQDGVREGIQALLRHDLAGLTQAREQETWDVRVAGLIAHLDRTADVRP
ncbi:hypothetical protein [Microbacterium sp. A93]|uniref:hypothetical protein n=1 Tax=Microbacterium sp. A93 TaxID=3450716 RepID=UPI003F4284EC